MNVTLFWKCAAVLFALALIGNNMHTFAGLMGALALAAGVLYMAFKEST